MSEPRNHRLHRAGHHAMRVVLGLMLALIALSAADLFATFPAGLDLVVSSVSAVVLLSALVGLWAHRRGLCEACISQMPLNGEEKAAQWDAYLATFHVMNRPLVGLPVLGAWVGLGFVLDPLIGRPASTIVTSGLAAWWYLSMIRHELVEPWCARCDWGGEGEEEWIPDSVPDPSASR